MSQINYINTQEIRQDLMGFLNRLAAGQKFVVLNRSKPVVTVTGKAEAISKEQARQNIQAFLAAAEVARSQAAGSLDPNKTYKELYTETMGEKYGIH